MSGFFSDERGSRSSGRVFLAGWLALFMVIALAATFAPEAIAGRALAVLTIGSTAFVAVATALIAWVAGSRIAQYIGPQIGMATSAVGQAVKGAADAVAARIYARRDPTDGTEPSR